MSRYEEPSHAISLLLPNSEPIVERTCEEVSEPLRSAQGLTYSSHDRAIECGQEGADPHASENDDCIDSTEADKSGESAFFAHQRVHEALTDIRANRLVSGRCCRRRSGTIFLRT